MSARKDMNILKPSEIDVSNLTCSEVRQAGVQKAVYINHGSGKGSLLVKPPEMEVKWDGGNWEPRPKNPTSGKYRVDVNMSGDSPEMPVFIEKMTEMDEYIKKQAQENSWAWFQKKSLSMDTIDNIYYPMVKVSVDKDTGEPNGKYPPSLKFKVQQYDGEVQCRIFDSDKKEMNVSDPSKEDLVTIGIVRPFDEQMTIPHEGIFKKGVKVKLLLKCCGIWIGDGKFGCTWQAMQIQVKNPPGLESYAFLDDSDEDEEGKQDTEGLQGNFVDSSDEEEDGGGLSRQVSVAQ
jgi:hypothetical protein